MRIYDRSNIAESYAGVTTPLTFSFVRYVYQEVYRHFCALLGVPKSAIRKHRDMYERMVVLLGYRIYYDLVNWYRLIALLPGYRFNRKFLESMMGVGETYRYVPRTSDSRWSRLADGARLLTQTVRISVVFGTLRWRVDRFCRYFDRTHARVSREDFRTLTDAEFSRTYRRLGAQLLARWSVPIANDFAVMVASGIVGRLYDSWVGDGAMHRVLGGRSGGLRTLDPGRELARLAQAVRADPDAQEWVASDRSAVAVAKHLLAQIGNPVAEGLRRYLDQYGSRIPNELKLESRTLEERPGDLVELLRLHLRGVGESALPHVVEPDPVNQLPLPFLRRRILALAVVWARAAIARREETRFRRTLIFGTIRRLFLGAGNRLVERGVLADARDVFYLTADEVFAALGGSKGVDAVRAEVEERRSNQSRWAQVSVPQRFEGPADAVGAEVVLRRWSDAQALKPTTTKPLRGRVVSALGTETVSGEAIVVSDFDPRRDFAGKVLVTPQTDPGWTPIFPMLRAVIVERGGMLSHAAIVARELGIPCIVGVEDATRRIPDGSTVTLDLSHGSVLLR